MSLENSFYDAYHEIFEIKNADTDELKECSFKLRYQAYCIENGYEVGSDDCVEKDDYDSHALHSLLIHKPTNTPIGTVRLVLPKDDELTNSFPIQESLEDSILKNNNLIKNMGELSRFTITKEARQIMSSHNAFSDLLVGENPSDRELQTKALAFANLGLIVAVAKMAIENGKVGVFAIMKPSLIKLLSRMGIEFKTVGDLVEYHGLRQLCYIDKDVFKIAKEHNVDIWALISEKGQLEELSKDFPTVEDILNSKT